MFRKITFVFTSFLFLNSCAVQQKSLSKKDWYAYTKNSSERVAPSKVYDFTDGIIRMYGDNIGYIATKSSFKNFELHLEYRWNMEQKFHRNDATKNSGVMYNIPSNFPDHIWPKGIQFQIKENTTGDFIFLDNITAKVNGKLVEAGASVVSPKFVANENPYGQWNNVLIKSLNGKLTQYLNGKLVNECVEVTSK